VLTPEEVEKYRGKFRRMCEPKKASGKIEVPQDIFSFKARVRPGKGYLKPSSGVTDRRTRVPTKQAW
jgi:hypothetical protein